MIPTEFQCLLCGFHFYKCLYKSSDAIPSCPECDSPQTMQLKTTPIKKDSKV